MEIFSFIDLSQPIKASWDLTDQAAEPQPKQATGRSSMIHEGDIFEMIPDNLAIAEIVILLDKTVVQGFGFGIADHFEFNGREVRELIL
jgi:hypothetical protein